MEKKASTIVIVDYGMGNLHSVQKAFEKCGGKAVTVRVQTEIADADALVVPGVGSFGDCVGNLRRLGLREPIIEFIKSGKPYLGICLGLQILFSSSEEAEGEEGLGIFRGRVEKFRVDLKIPHMGWNTLDLNQHGMDCPLFKGIHGGAYAYFVHSYYAAPEDKEIIAAETQYGTRFTSAIWKDNVIATQFHLEKSQEIGLAMISNFIKSVVENQENINRKSGAAVP